MTDTKNLHTKVKVTIYGEESFFGPGIAELMSLVVKTGSVKAACREMGLSYTKGWTILNRAERETGCELIKRNHGGKDGGSTDLTNEGQSLLDRYFALEKEVNEYTQKVFEEKFRN